MSQIIGPPPPLGPDFDDNVKARISAHRRRRYARSFGAAVLVIAMTGAAIAMSASGGNQHRTEIRTAADTARQTSSLPDASTEPSTTTASTPPIASSSTSTSVTATATVPPVTAPTSTEAPVTAPPTTASSCPSGGVFLNGTTKAIRKGTDDQGVPTWLVTASATITNNSSATVDVSFWVTVIGDMGPGTMPNVIVFDSPSSVDHPLTLSPGETKSFPLINYDPVAKDGSNAVASTQPNGIYQGITVRRWQDLTLRSSCPVPGKSAPFLVDDIAGPILPGWPGM